MRFKAYRQLEHSDCGITCIRMIARYYGRSLSVSQLRGIVDYSRIGVTIGDILNCSRKIGMHTHAIRIGLSDLMRMPLPAILYWDQRHYVVLYNKDVKKKIFYVADPALGKVSFNEEEFFRHWKEKNGNNGVAIIMAPTDAFYSLRVEKQSNGLALCKLLRKSVVKNKSSFGILALLALVLMCADILLPLIFQRTIDEGIGQRDIGLIWLLSLSQLSIIIGGYVASSVNELVLTRMGLRVSIKMMNEYLAKLIRLPMSFFDKKVNSDFIQKIDDQNRLKNFLVSMPQTLFITGLNLVVFSVMLVYYSPLSFLIFIIATSLSLVWTKLFMKKRREIDYSQFSYSSENRNNIYELVNGMPEIKVNNAQNIRVSIWSELQEKINCLVMKQTYINLSVNTGNNLFAQLKDISIIGLCATMVILNDMTIGVMMTISYIAGRLAYPFNTIINSISTVQDASLSYERLDEIINNNDKAKSDIQNLKFDNIQIKLQDVSFKYPGSFSPYVIKNFSTIIEDGKTIAVVGASGCGKSTLFKLLLGFYPPVSGKIFISGYDLSKINNDEWMQNCAIVSQHGYIFSGTILENIAMCDKHPNKEKAQEACELACIKDYISTLPMGIYTQIGNAGIELSGGQKQRILIARAIYKQPKLLLLDEATSALDAATERCIVENFEKLTKNRTVVIAAHRLSTVRIADRILFMKNGVITESGTHNELIKLKGDYFNLVQQQL